MNRLNAGAGLVQYTRIMDKRELWILTRSVNDYNQHGDYFVAAWTYKPGMEELAKAAKLDKRQVFDKAVLENLVNNGGGRLELEDVWYNLFRIKEGKPKHYAY